MQFDNKHKCARLLRAVLAVIMFTSLALGGSRSLNHCPLVGAVVQSAISAGASLSVGCCVGADALVIQAALGISPRALRLFAQFSQSGQGALSISAVGPVQAAVSAGAPVQWLAGGALSVPVQARLIQRSQAVVQSAQALALFAPGAGSLAVAAFAVSVGRPVFVFAPCAPSLAGGAFVAGHLFGHSCWQFVPSQLSLF